MKVAFIVLKADHAGEEVAEEIKRVQSTILSTVRYWRLEKITLLPEESEDIPSA